MTKAVQLHRNGGGLVLTKYALQDAPIYEKGITADLLGEHLKAVFQTLEPKTRTVSLALSVTDSFVRHADLPQMPVGTMRQVLKLNSKNYLQQELADHVFDCFVIPPRESGNGKAPGKAAGPGANNVRVLAAAARGDLIDTVQNACRQAGLNVHSLVPGLVGPVNAFECAMPEVFSKEAVALVDMGFKCTTICLLDEGELVLSRVVNIGGDRLTTGLAEALGTSYAEAESIKVGIPAEVQAQLQSQILPLARELRASIDCFEHQHDRAVTKVFVSGGSARSELIVQILQADLMAECKAWNPVGFVKLALSPGQTEEVTQVAPQLAVAVGAAVAAF
jgi:type IV pilus assembly protein PilM